MFTQGLRRNTWIHLHSPVEWGPPTNSGYQTISCLAILGKNFLALPLPASPLLKKKLAPSKLFLLKIPATVREIYS